MRTLISPRYWESITPAPQSRANLNAKPLRGQINPTWPLGREMRIPVGISFFPLAGITTSVEDCRSAPASPGWEYEGRYSPSISQETEDCSKGVTGLCLSGRFTRKQGERRRVANWSGKVKGLIDDQKRYLQGTPLERVPKTECYWRLRPTQKN